MMNSKQKFYQLSTPVCLGFIVGFAVILRLLIGMLYHNSFDLGGYNIPWAIGIQDGLFNAYSHVKNLDYPPLFPFFLYFVGDAVKAAQAAEVWQLEMFYIKLIPILFDVALVISLYFVGLRHSQSVALLLSAAWALNISAIFNCSFWGQTDSMLLLFVLFTFVTLHRKMPVWACVFFALGCLTKLQMVYFTPILLCELFTGMKPWRACKALGVGIATGILGWLPFMIGSKEPLLPIRIYLSGYDSYNFINLNACNVYGLTKNNWIADSKSIFGGSLDEKLGFFTGGFTYVHLNQIVTVLIIGSVLTAYVFLYRKKMELPAALHALFFMNSIFMLTTKMHERYQMPVLILSLLCFILCKDRRWFYVFLGMTAVTFLNQAALLLRMNFHGLFDKIFEQVQPVTSVINLALYLVVLLLYLQAIANASQKIAVDEDV